ncbi:MAG: Glycosyl transferase family 2 [Microgenomates bacterium 39_7]|nr:MAG: Glycosyl transferase family 2 [Microgenomates bacterium 39_7]
MKLSVIVPVYNEEQTVKKLLQKLLKVKQISEIIVVDDGSTDSTKKILQTFKSNKIKVFHQSNQGKGSAVRLGLSKVKGDYVLIQDADLEYDPQDVKQLLYYLDREGVEVVYGSRFLGPHSNLLFWHRVGNHLLNALVNLLYDTTLSDMETCYKLAPTDLMKELDLKANGFELEPEITCKILKRKIKIFEVPISYVGRGFDEGKKITWKDGVTAFWTVLKLRYN